MIGLNWLLVAVGGFFGAICRYAIINFIKNVHHSSFPLGTLCVNLSGSFLLGILNGMMLNHYFMSFLGIGFMGAFTTFSTFKLETVQLIVDRHYFAVINLLLTYIAGIGFAYLGIILGKIII
ncbi:fluoride efflux transporter CrcB [Bacillus sp. 03113]|uniref:fluoride efflux transporter CrcB n=1 Tax=Bacillus sp. 03113 TaxID=2578211 RepID=UPI0011446A77|nr:fluoride efflux transporter CrcB [Bacillus sp. 03113]